MIYLNKEREQFKETKAAFGEAYAALLQKMVWVADAKGADRDVGSPIHHRMAPATMLAMVQAKSRRIETLISAPGWSGDSAALRSKVIEECTDIANYALFIGALCVLLEEEAKDVSDNGHAA